MYQRGDIKEGMTVRSIDGHKLGKVYAVGETEFHIEKGLFFPKDYAVRYAEISELRHGEIILAHGQESLRTFSESEGLRTQDLGAQDIGPYNTEGARASPILTEEDRGIGRPLTDKGTDLPILPPVMERTAPLRAEEESARQRALLDERTVTPMDELYDEPRRVVTTRGDGHVEGTRKLELSSKDDPLKRGR